MQVRAVAYTWLRKAMLTMRIAYKICANMVVKLFVPTTFDS